MIDLLGLCAAIAGLLLLCAAMQRHQAEIFGARLDAQLVRYLRFGGGALVFACWLIDALGLGWGTGTVTALGQLTLAAGLAIMALHVRAATRKKSPIRKT